MIAKSKRYRRAHAIVAFWDGGDFVFENYLTGKQTTLSPLIAQLLGDLVEPRSLAHLRRLFVKIPCANEVIDSLIEADILLEHGSPVERDDKLLEQTWRWGHDARFFHFSTQRVAFQEPEEERSALARLARVERPPQITRDYDGDGIALRQTFDARTGGLWDALRRRRTHRRFARRSISLDAFTTLTQWSWGATHLHTDPVLGPFQLKTSPSGGARHPIEVYPTILRVEGLKPGMYHYSSTSNELTLRKPGMFEDLVVGLCADQPWVRDAAVVFFMTAVVEKSMWKYRHSHAYRVIQLDAGHLGQTFHLISTELGLAPFTTAALAARQVEAELGLDGISEVAIYAAVAGPPKGESTDEST